MSDKLTTLPKAAEEIGINYRNLLQARDQGLFPTYQLGNTRQFVKLPEVIAALQVNFNQPTEKENNYVQF